MHLLSSAPAGYRAAEGAVAILMRFLAERISSLVVIGRIRKGKLLVEDGYPDCGFPGQRLTLATGMVDVYPLSLDVGTLRLPLDWTQLCGGRPMHVASAPIGGGDLYLFAISTGDEAPPLDEIASVAAAMGPLLRTGETTTKLEQITTRRMSALVDQLPLPFVFVDTQSIEVFLNNPARRLLNISPSETREPVVAAALTRMIDQADWEKAAILHNDPQATSRFDIDDEGRSFDVETRWVNEQGLMGRFWMFREVTEERAAKRFKDQLISNVSHELRSPLTSILGALSLVRAREGEEMNGAASMLIDVATRNAERLGRLVNDLLDAEKLEADSFKLVVSSTNLADLLAEAVTLHQPAALHRSIHIDLDVPSGSVVIDVDPDRLLQVFSNLISNAVKFSPDGSHVFVQLRHSEDRVRISVIDQGGGIKPDFRDKLFTRFSQENRKLTGQPGTGLGLAISKSIVERLGGDIFLDTETSIGAAFHVEFPQGGQSRC